MGKIEGFSFLSKPKTVTKPACQSSMIVVVILLAMYLPLFRMEQCLGGTANTNNYDAISTTYDFTSTPTTTIRQHFTSANTTTALVTIANQYIYDHVVRKLKTWDQITNGSSSTFRRESDAVAKSAKATHIFVKIIKQG